MDKETTYIISKLNEIKVLYPNLEFSFGINAFMETYNILIQDTDIYNSIDFKNFEGALILDFIQSFESNYSVFFTDDVNYFETDKIIYNHIPLREEEVSAIPLNKFNSFSSFNTIKNSELFNDYFDVKFTPNKIKINKSLLDLFEIKYEKNSVQRIFKSHKPLKENFINKNSLVNVENEQYALAA